MLHRDIKPENLVLNSNGYVHITDFGIAKKYSPFNGKDTSGTMGYIAPEVLRGDNHSYCVDFYAIGIIAYEFLFGNRPYLARTKRELRELILTHQAQVNVEELPSDWSHESADFINKLIQRKPKKRLGYNDINDIKQHKWFADFDWNSLQNLSIKSPYIPKRVDNFDKKYCGAIDKIGNETLERYNQYLMDDQYEFKFIKFSYNIIPDELKPSSKYILAYQINNTGDSTTRDTNCFANNNYNNNNNCALQQKLSRNNKNEKKHKRTNKNKDGCSRSISYSVDSVSISVSSKIENSNKSKDNQNNYYKVKYFHKKEKQLQQHSNRNKRNNSNNQSGGAMYSNNKFIILNNNKKLSPSKSTSLFALYGPNINSYNNINNGSRSNNSLYDKDSLLRPCYPGIRHKNKKISVLSQNNVPNKKNISFLLNINHSNSLSSSRQKSPISSSNSKEKTKRLSSSNSSKHLYINNNIHHKHLVADKKLPVINLSFNRRKNLFNRSIIDQDLSFGNYAPQIINYSERRGNHHKIRNQFCSLNFYYRNNNGNSSLNQRIDEGSGSGSGHNSGNHSLMNKSSYHMGSICFPGMKRISGSSKNNNSVSIGNFI